MSGWIKFWKDMPNDPRVLSAAVKLAERYVLARRTPGGGGDLSMTEACNAWRNTVTGAIATLWCYADEHIRDDDSLPLTSQTIDTIVGIEGFFDVMPREWIDELDDGSIVLPGYCKKNSLIVKRKRTIKSNARVTRWRRAKKTNGNGVTVEHATQCNAAGDLDQDRDLYKDPKSKTRTASVTPRDDEPEWWIAFKQAYPQRSGDQGWSKARRAANARMAEGHRPEDFVAGAKRYLTYCEATGSIGTQYVKQASSFLGPDAKPPLFLQEWIPPANKAEVRQNRNISASEQWLRDQEAKDAAH